VRQGYCYPSFARWVVGIMRGLLGIEGPDPVFTGVSGKIPTDFIGSCIGLLADCSRPHSE